MKLVFWLTPLSLKALLSKPFFFVNLENSYNLDIVHRWQFVYQGG